MSCYAEIVKTKSKKAPFRVRYIGKNGEVLAVSECLNTRHNAKKNILALMNLFDSEQVYVYDRTSKPDKGRFLLHDYGYEQYI